MPQTPLQKQNCWTVRSGLPAGGDPSILYVKPADAEIVAGFTGSSGRTRNFNDETKTLTNVVDVLVNPYGTLRVVLSRHQRPMPPHRPSMWRTCVLRPVTRTLLAKNSDSDRHLVVGEMTLKHMNFSADGCVTGLS